MPLKVTSDIDLRKTASALVKAAHVEVPRKVSVEGLQWFNNSFRNQGFTNNTLIPWRGTKSGKRNQFGLKSSGILIKSGRLRRGNKATIYTDRVRFTNDVPYAEAHNEGFKGTQTVKAHERSNYFTTKVKGGYDGLGKKKRAATLHILKGTSEVKSFTRTMNLPKRQFMGFSQQLINNVRQIVLNTLYKETH